MTHVTLQMDSSLIVTSGFIQGLGIGFTFVPLSSAAFATLAPRLRNEGTPIFSLLRNIGGSVGISIVQALLTRGTAAAHADLATHVARGNPGLADWSQVMGDPATSLAVLNAEVTRQAALIAYVNDFWIMMAVTALAIPLLLLVRPPKRNAAAASGDVPH
jgi:DHA2 family multidrug resistance protein